MKLPVPGSKYDADLMKQAFSKIEQALAGSAQKGDTIELSFGSSIIIRSPDKSRWKVTISNTGTLTTTAL